MTTKYKGGGPWFYIYGCTRRKFMANYTRSSLKDRYRKMYRVLRICRISTGWDQADANNAKNVISCKGYVIMYSWCSLLWWSKLQTETAVSTTESEYNALIQVMRKVIPLMELMKEGSSIFDIHLPRPEFYC